MCLHGAGWRPKHPGPEAPEHADPWCARWLCMHGRWNARPHTSMNTQWPFVASPPPAQRPRSRGRHSLCIPPRVRPCAHTLDAHMHETRAKTLHATTVPRSHPYLSIFTAPPLAFAFACACMHAPQANGNDLLLAANAGSVTIKTASGDVAVGGLVGLVSDTLGTRLVRLTRPLRREACARGCGKHAGVVAGGHCPTRCPSCPPPTPPPPLPP